MIVFALTAVLIQCCTFCGGAALQPDDEVEFNQFLSFLPFDGDDNSHFGPNLKMCRSVIQEAKAYYLDAGSKSPSSIYGKISKRVTLIMTMFKITPSNHLLVVKWIAALISNANGFLWVGEAKGETRYCDDPDIHKEKSVYKYVKTLFEKAFDKKVLDAAQRQITSLLGIYNTSKKKKSDLMHPIIASLGAFYDVELFLKYQPYNMVKNLQEVIPVLRNASFHSVGDAIKIDKLIKNEFLSMLEFSVDVLGNLVTAIYPGIVNDVAHLQRMTFELSSARATTSIFLSTPKQQQQLAKIKGDFVKECSNSGVSLTIDSAKDIFARYLFDDGRRETLWQDVNDVLNSKAFWKSDKLSSIEKLFYLSRQITIFTPASYWENQLYAAEKVKVIETPWIRDVFIGAAVMAIMAGLFQMYKRQYDYE